MKILNERRAQMNFERTFDKSRNWGVAYIAESVTNYYVTIKIFGYACVSVDNWKISKREAANMLEAVAKIAKQAREHGNL